MSDLHQKLYPSHRLFKYYWETCKGRPWNKSFLAGEEWVWQYDYHQEKIKSRKRENLNPALMDKQ